VLEARVRAPTTAQRDVLRARIILLAADGRFARDGLAGLTDNPRPGPTPKYGAESGRRILRPDLRAGPDR
jgi:hypothetical protein